MSYSGPISALDLALAGLTFTPMPQFHGDTALTLHAGSNGARSIQAGVLITDGVFVVTTTADSGPGSLRQAIIDSDGLTGGTNTIEFDIAGSGVHTISILSSLPVVAGSILIDGTSQPGYAGSPLIALDATASGSSDGLTTCRRGDLSVRGLVNTGIVFGITSASDELTVQSAPHTQGQGGSAGQVDSYRIDTTTDALLVVRVHAIGVSTRLSLVDSVGRVLVESDGISPGDPDDEIYEHLPAGTYSLVVDSTAGAGSYTLTATWTPASAPLQQIPLEGTFGPQGMVVGDFNGDGIPDIATPYGVDLGVGDGTFRSSSNGLLFPSTANFLTAIVDGDFTNDGHLDLVVGDYTSDTVYLLLGNGDGTFQTALPISVGNFPAGDHLAAMAAGDFNGDGNLDLAVAFGDNGGTDPGGIEVLLGNGNGTFGAPSFYAAGYVNIGDLVAGQFSGDGHLDLAVTNFSVGTVTVLMGNGDGTFGAPTSFPAGADALSIAMGDFNGDGNLDLAVNSDTSDTADASIAILLGNGNGTFGAPSFYAAGNGPQSVVAGDFNGDGKLDIAAAELDAGGANYVYILSGNGDGTFGPPQELFSVQGSSAYPTLVAADFLGNGRLDLAETTFNDAVTVLLQNPDGTFETPDQNKTVVAVDPNLIVDGDFNDDGKLDLIDLSAGTSSILLGNGDGTFQAQKALPFGDGSTNFFLAAPSAVAGDFNGDGRPDLVIGGIGADGGGEIMLGNGDGTFQLGGTVALPFVPSLLLDGDFNDDGKLDLVAIGTGEIAVLLGNGNGTFQPAETTVVASSAYGSVVLGDFNGDGKLDLALVAGTYGAYQITMLLGNGDGTFQPATVVEPLANPGAYVYPGTELLAGDFNGDGKLDLATVLSDYDGDEELAVMMGNGDGSFQPAQTYTLGISAHYLEAGDFTGGGKPDIVVVGENGSDFDVATATFVNNGDGTFQPEKTTDLGSTSLFTSNEGEVVAGDFNGDGRQDLAFIGFDSDVVSIVVSNGDGTFSDPALSVTTPYATPVLADVNGDGTEDVLVVDGAGDILYRQGITGRPGTFEPPVTVNPGFPSRDIALVTTGGGPVLASVDAQDDAISLYAWRDGGFLRIGSLTTGQLPAQIIAADLSGDGLTDLVVRNAGDGTLSVFFGRTFTGPVDPKVDFQSFLPPVTLSVGLGVSDVQAVDTTGSGRLDLVVTNKLTAQVSILRNLGDGAFAPPTIYRAGTGLSSIDDSSASPEVTSQEATAGVAAGPLTPGWPTGLGPIHSGADRMAIIGGLGGDRFANPVTLPTQGPAQVVRMGDFAGNGIGDLAVLTAAEVSIYLGDGKGGFLPPTDYAVPPESDGLTVANLNGNGKLDLLVGDAYGDVLVLMGNGDGTFQPYHEANQTIELAVANLTGNGSKDIIYADQSLDRVVVDDGAANSAVLANQSTGLLDPGAVALADLNGDGIPDLIVANSDSNNVLIYPGLGNGQFGPAINDGNGYFVGTNPMGITVADLTAPCPTWSWPMKAPTRCRSCSTNRRREAPSRSPRDHGLIPAARGRCPPWWGTSPVDLSPTSWPPIANPTTSRCCPK